MSKFFKALSLVVFAASFATMPVTVPDAIAGSFKVKGERKVEKDKFKPFFVTLDFGEEKTIAKAGPFKVFARCIVIPAGGPDIVRIIVTSEEAGWFAETDEDPIANGGPFAADAEAAALQEAFPTGLPIYSNNPDKFSAIGPDDDGDLYYVSIDGDTVGLGLNIFGNDCLAVGNVSIMKLDN